MALSLYSSVASTTVFPPLSAGRMVTLRSLLSEMVALFSPVMDGWAEFLFRTWLVAMILMSVGDRSELTVIITVAA